MVCPTRRLRVGQDDDHPHYGARDDGHTAHRRRGPQQGPGYAGGGYSTVKINLPANWDELMTAKGYRPLSTYCH